MTETSPPQFRVHCTACYGSELWKFEHVIHSLTEAGVSLPDDHQPDKVIELLFANCKHLTCPGCGKRNAMIIRRIERGGAWTWEETTQCEGRGEAITEPYLLAHPGIT